MFATIWHNMLSPGARHSSNSMMHASLHSMSVQRYRDAHGLS